jgi:hypothetical protein
MSDKIFEEKLPEGSVAQPDEPINKKKPRKKRAPMSEERKKQLCEQLKKAREISAMKRSAKSKEKKLKKLKEVEAEVENSIVENIKKRVEPKSIEVTHEKPKENTDDLEARIEKRLRMKLENEYSHKYKDDKIARLEEQLKEHKNKKISKPIESLDNIQNDVVETKQPKPTPVIDNVSNKQARTLMDKYKRIREKRGF